MSEHDPNDKSVKQVTDTDEARSSNAPSGIMLNNGTELSNKQVDLAFTIYNKWLDHQFDKKRKQRNRSK